MEKCPLPEPGSIQEALCINVRRSRDNAEVYKTLFLGISGDRPDDKKKAYETYLHFMFPFMAEEEKNVVAVDPAKVLKELFERGPMVIEQG